MGAGGNWGRTRRKRNGRVLDPIVALGHVCELGMEKQVDLFISHASEDKDIIARPLAEALRQNAFRVWYDEYTLKLGAPLRRTIDEGLNRCQYGIVILSHAFFAKEWPQRELDGMFAREVDEGRPLILPIWHDVVVGDVRRYSATLADRVAISSAKGIPAIVAAVRQLFEDRVAETPVRQEITPVSALLFPPMVSRPEPLQKCLSGVVAAATEVMRTVLIRRIERLSLPEQILVLEALSTSGVISDESGNLLPPLMDALRCETMVERRGDEVPSRLFDYVFGCGELDKSLFARSIRADAITSVVTAVRGDERGTRELIMALRDSCEPTAHTVLGWALDATSTAVENERRRSPSLRWDYWELFWEEPLARIRAFWESAESEV